MRQGIGIHDSGRFPKTLNGKRHPLSRKWDDMFLRCYSEKKLAARPSYIGCTVAPEFHRYQDFCEWAVDKIGGDKADWQLDKDILVRGNTVYSPDTCCFVPRVINQLFHRDSVKPRALPSGVHHHENKFAAILAVRKGRKWLGRFDSVEQAFAVYKEEKENFIKLIAEEYRSIISSAVYESMLAYQVEMMD